MADLLLSPETQPYLLGIGALVGVVSFLVALLGLREKPKTKSGRLDLTILRGGKR